MSLPGEFVPVNLIAQERARSLSRNQDQLDTFIQGDGMILPSVLTWRAIIHRKNFTEIRQYYNQLKEFMDGLVLFNYFDRLIEIQDYWIELKMLDSNRTAEILVHMVQSETFEQFTG